MQSEILIGIISGMFGGAIGVLSTILATYWGPRKLEEWREQRKEGRLYGPRKRLLRALLEKPGFEQGRPLDLLCLYSGTDPGECRRLLVEIGAHGVLLAEGKEGWLLRPL